MNFPGAIIWFCVALSTGVAILCMDAHGGELMTRSDQVVENLDSSKTIVRPRVLGDGERLGIRGGIPGACLLFGMHGYLKDYVVWSSDLKNSVHIGKNGEIGEVRNEHYLESITCTPKPVHRPKITVQAIEENSDGSVTVRFPQIHDGPSHFPVLSGHAGVCRMLGYDEVVEYSRVWSAGSASGVSMAFDGQIYEKASGTHLTALGCKKERYQRSSSTESKQFPEELRDGRDKN